MSAPSTILNYIASKQTKGGLAWPKDREKALTYRNKAELAKEEERKQVKTIEDKLRSEYSSENTVRYEKLSFKSMYLHYKFGRGRSLYVDITGQRIPSLSAKRDFNDEVGREQLLNSLNLSNLSTIGITVGSAKFRYLGNRKVEILGDRYDFDIRKGASLERNILTLIGGLLHTGPLSLTDPVLRDFTWSGQGFSVIFKGEAIINP